MGSIQLIKMTKMYLYVTIGINLKNITLNAKNFIRIHSTRPTYVDVKTYQWLIVTHDPVYPSSNKKTAPHLRFGRVYEYVVMLLDIFWPPLKLGIAKSQILPNVMWAEICVQLHCYILKCVRFPHPHHYLSFPSDGRNAEIPTSTT